MQERCNSIAKALELRLLYINLLIYALLCFVLIFCKIHTTDLEPESHPEIYGNINPMNSLSTSTKLKPP